MNTTTLWQKLEQAIRQLPRFQLVKQLTSSQLLNHVLRNEIREIRLNILNSMCRKDNPMNETDEAQGMPSDTSVLDFVIDFLAINIEAVKGKLSKNCYYFKYLPEEAHTKSGGEAYLASQEFILNLITHNRGRIPDQNEIVESIKDFENMYRCSDGCESCPHAQPGLESINVVQQEEKDCL